MHKISYICILFNARIVFRHNAIKFMYIFVYIRY